MKQSVTILFTSITLALLSNANMNLAEVTRHEALFNELRKVNIEISEHENNSPQDLAIRNFLTAAFCFASEYPEETLSKAIKSGLLTANQTFKRCDELEKSLNLMNTHGLEKCYIKNTFTEVNDQSHILEIAVSMGNRQCLQLLLDNGATIDRKILDRIKSRIVPKYKSFNKNLYDFRNWGYHTAKILTMNQKRNLDYLENALAERRKNKKACLIKPLNCSKSR